mgnify:CR=1 FL=1
MSQYENSGASVTASISYSMASASGSVSTGSYTGSTAQDEGWS